jgi:hypothetical protein
MIRIVLATLLALVGVTRGATKGVPIDQSGPFSDDRAVLEAVTDEIWRRAGGPALHVGRPPAEPIFVVQGARPVCREKVYERDPPWPLMCAPDSQAIEPTLTTRARLSAIERTELVRSLKERNSQWRDLPALPSTRILWLPRQEYIDGARRIDLAVVSLPGYSSGGHAVVFATFACGSLCGTAWYAILAYADGAWGIVDFISLGVA